MWEGRLMEKLLEITTYMNHHNYQSNNCCSSQKKQLFEIQQFFKSIQFIGFPTGFFFW